MGNKEKAVDALKYMLLCKVMTGSVHFFRRLSALTKQG